MDTYHHLLSFPKKCINIFSFFSLILILACTHPAKAQLIDSGEILRAGSEDANLLLQEYLKPFGGGFGADLNSGWFASAKPLNTFGFDLRISASASFVPEKHQLFDVTKLNLSTVRLLEGPAQTPTAFGDNAIETSTLGTVIDQVEVFSFEMPEGIGYHFVPAPMAQFSLGLPGHIQVTLRYTPTVEIYNEYQLNVLGIGGMIGLNPLLFSNELPFDVSLQAGFMNLNADATFDVRPMDDENVKNPYPDSHWDGQGLDFKSQGFTANVLGGKKFSVLSLFAGAGYQTSLTTISTRGSYPIVFPVSQETESGTSQEVQSLEEPINFTLDGENNIHLLGGLRLDIALLSVSATYILAEYPTLRAGIGIKIDP